MFGPGAEKIQYDLSFDLTLKFSPGIESLEKITEDFDFSIFKPLLFS